MIAETQTGMNNFSHAWKFHKISMMTIKNKTIYSDE
jgi:hypothetical protein